MSAMGPLTEDDWGPVFQQSKYIYPLDSDGIDIVASLSRYCKTKCQSIVVVFGTRLEARVFVDTYTQRMDLGHITTLCTRERVGSVTQLYDVVVYYNARLPPGPLSGDRIASSHQCQGGRAGAPSAEELAGRRLDELHGAAMGVVYVHGKCVVDV